MKTKITTTITEIECSAEELRQSNTLADGLTNLFRRTFNGPVMNFQNDDEEEEDE